MRSLAQPETMCAAAIAALFTGLVSYPRLWLWAERPNALWFLLTLLLLTSFVLWSFVFAWYPSRTDRPVLQFALASNDWLTTAAMGVAGAVLLALLVDPKLKALNPADYPDTLPDWVANVLFSISFSQLFLCYAPVALFLRLLRHRTLAIVLTVLFGEFLLALQLESAVFHVDLPFKILLFGVRAALGWAAAYLFVRGGLLLAMIWSFLLECRLFTF